MQQLKAPLLRPIATCQHQTQPSLTRPFRRPHFLQATPNRKQAQHASPRSRLHACVVAAAAPQLAEGPNGLQKVLLKNSSVSAPWPTPAAQSVWPMACLGLSCRLLLALIQKSKSPPGPIAEAMLFAWT